MNNLTKTTYKTFFYNLIVFDFIFLNPTNKKLSHFYLEQIIFNKDNYFFKLSIFELLKSFKLFIRLFQFLSKKSKIKKYSNKLFLYIWCNNYQNIKFLNFFLKKYNLDTPFKVTNSFPRIGHNSPFFKNVLVLNQQLQNSNYKNFFSQNLYLIQKVGAFNELKNWGSYKIYNNLNDIKKLILLSLVLVQIFKK